MADITNIAEPAAGSGSSGADIASALLGGVAKIFGQLVGGFSS
ncbi:hypothetical protein [Rhodococcus tukisamuensis]|uniref:Uncharacterized protein n=1 Tax=Rhodococcus tukisamuensis TaxID=168276 RepID=A0A1G6MRS1_9NOCA|nr:hypothetical protein [Rhodococcus tukisamuensis]SDC58259.1 hypothetical protein SAMN05444580_101286 [Rhodococcus tukisamuensis]